MKEISVFSQRNTVQSWFSDAVGLRKNCHYIEYIDKSNDSRKPNEAIERL